MNYELAKELKESGFPQKVRVGTTFYPYPDSNERVWNSEEELTPPNPPDMVITPTLSELIEACGDEFYGVIRSLRGTFTAVAVGNDGVERIGSTPEEAVARLWLELRRNEKAT